MTNNKTEGVDLYPGHQYQRLFNAISDTNGIATQDELDEIIRIAREDFPPSPPAGVEQRAKGGIWVRASERLPERSVNGTVIYKYDFDYVDLSGRRRQGKIVTYDDHVPVKFTLENEHHFNVEWLDETQSIAGSESQGEAVELRNLLENVVIAYGMGWDMDGVIEKAREFITPPPASPK